MDRRDDEPSAEATVRAFVDAWNRLDMDGVAGILAPDICYHNIPLAPLYGKESVERYLRSVGPFDSCNWRLVTIAVSGNSVMTERVDAFVVAGTDFAAGHGGI